MKPSIGNIWNQPKHRKPLEVAARSIAEVFGKEGEFDSFIIARDKLLTVKYDPSSGNADYKALKQEELKAVPDWLEPVAMVLTKLYVLGLERGRSESRHD